MDIGKTVRRHRRLAGLTPAELANAVGTTQANISRIERGAQLPAADAFARMLEARGADLVIERWGAPPELGADAGTLGGREAETLRHIAFRRVRCVIIGAVAERLHGSDVAVDGVEIVAVPHPVNGRRVERVREIADLRMRPPAPLRVLWGPPKPFTSHADLARHAVRFETETSHFPAVGRRLSRRDASGTPPRR